MTPIRFHRCEHEQTVGERPVEKQALTLLSSNVNTSPHGKIYGRHFAGDIFKWIFVNEKFCNVIWIRISLRFVPKYQFDNKAALVHVMAWRRIGDKSLPEPVLTQSGTVHWRIYAAPVGRWVNSTAVSNVASTVTTDQVGSVWSKWVLVNIGNLHPVMFKLLWSHNCRTNFDRIVITAEIYR